MAAMASIFLAAPAPVWAADCVDTDGDGFVTCSGCDLPGGKECGDCAEGDANTFPGASQICSETSKKSEDCNVTDANDPFLNAGLECGISRTNEFGTCETQGTDKCINASTMTCSILDANGDPLPNDQQEALLDVAAPELLAANNASCFDEVDNDCDGKIDHDDDANGYSGQVCKVNAEMFCNGFDDDKNGQVDDGNFNVGDDCSAGIGACLREGTFECNLAQDGTECTAVAGSGSPEAVGELSLVNGVSGPSCEDGIDNDCDGLTDLNDDPAAFGSSCLANEICDGQDNDNNGDTDEGFPGLDNTCTAKWNDADTAGVGISACAQSGKNICNAAGDGVVCNATALLPSAEGPTGPTCSDGIDNDCDGDVDKADLDCTSANLAVSCRLVPLRKGGKNPPGTSCEETFRLEITSNAPSQSLSAEVMGLYPDGSLVDMSPFASKLTVTNGQEVHFNSRTNPDDFKLDKQGRFVDVFAPVPMARVTADTGQNRVEAFCSHIPWLNIDQPTEGQVVSASEGDIVKVVVPIPRVNPASLGIVVDGVDILDELGINPASAFPTTSGPLPGGTVDINGQMVKVSNLVVDTPAKLDVFGKNVLTMTLENLGGGGHIVVVNGDPRSGALSSPTSDQCHLDDVLDAAIMSVFGITIHTPAKDTEVPAPTHVTATIEHGRAIDSAKVQGVVADLGPQSCNALEFEAFGQTFSVDTCSREIDESLARTNLTQAPKLGTIDVGQNVLTIEAQDDVMNTTFAQQRFVSGTGTTQAPGLAALSPQARTAAEKALENKIEGSFDSKSSPFKSMDVEVTRDAVNFNFAFTFGASEDGINGLFGGICKDATDQVRAAVGEALKGPIATVHIDQGFPLCDLDLVVTASLFTTDLQCGVDAQGGTAPSDIGFVTVSAALEEASFSARIADTCKRTAAFVCISSISVDFDATVKLLDWFFGFKIDENLALSGGTKDGEWVDGTIDVDILNEGSGLDIGCIAGFFADVLDFITFGLIDPVGDLNNAIRNELDFNVDIGDALRANDPDPLEVKQIELNKSFVENDGLEIQQDILAVEITGEPNNGSNNPNTKDGLTATIGANFTVPLPQQDGVEATVLEPLPAPLYPLNADDVFFAPSDDIFNLLFAAVGLQGLLTTSCDLVETANPDPNPNVVNDPLTFGDTLPANAAACNALVGANGFQTGVMIGRCHGAIGTDCNTLTDGGHQFFCAATRDQLAQANITRNTNLLFCGTQPVGPRTLFRDDPNVPVPPGAVEAQIKANDMAIHIAMDRDGDGQFDPNQFFPLAQGCLGLFEDVTKDCKWSSACFDLLLATEFSLGTNSVNGNSQILREVKQVTGSAGTECAGGLNLGSTVLTEAGASSPVSIIQENIQETVKIFEPLGLDLGGFLELKNPRLISIDVPNYSDVDCNDCAEYIGITGGFQQIQSFTPISPETRIESRK